MDTDKPKRKLVFKEKICLCGCNQNFMPTGSRQTYIDGHKKPTPPKKKASDDGLKDDFISSHLKTDKKHEFDEYNDKNAEGKRFDSVCIRTFMSAGLIALRELGMTSITIKKNGYEFKIEKYKE
jgi:hypothetical protein